MPPQDIIEGSYAEYHCAGSLFGSMKLTGDYTEAEFSSDGSAEIVDGTLRIKCPKTGSFVAPTVWPKCRDTSITHCSAFPDVSAHGLVSVFSHIIPVTWLLAQIFNINAYIRWPARRTPWR